MNYLLIILLLLCNALKAQESNPSEKLEFLPKTLKQLESKKRWMETEYAKTNRVEIKLSSYAIPLTEFKIGKKYCLFGTKSWDDKCQDTAMQFAFKDKWQAIKKVTLDFVEYTNNDDYEKIISLLDTEDTIFLWGERRDGLYTPIAPERYKYNLSKEYIKVTKNEPKMSEYDLYILRDSMRCWKIAIKGMKYKDFRVYYYPYNPESRFIRIYLSRYLFIDIDYDDFTLSSIGYF